jgi:hypothetical protein
MLQPSRIINAFAILAAPAVSLAHPGHLDDMPIAHNLSHGLQYAVALLALGIIAHVIKRVLHARAKRKPPKA